MYDSGRIHEMPIMYVIWNSKSEITWRLFLLLLWIRAPSWPEMILGRRRQCGMRCDRPTVFKTVTFVGFEQFFLCFDSEARAVVNCDPSCIKTSFTLPNQRHYAVASYTYLIRI